MIQGLDPELMCIIIDVNKIQTQHIEWKHMQCISMTCSIMVMYISTDVW